MISSAFFYVPLLALRCWETLLFGDRRHGKGKGATQLSRRNRCADAGATLEASVSF